MSRLIQSEDKMHRYLVFIILAVVLNVDYLELDEYDLASPASVEASGTIELKEMESVIGELFEMSGGSRGGEKPEPSGWTSSLLQHFHIF